jgi:opine dehydrogenase
MRGAILGAGATAFNSAALLARNGHQPVLWSPSGRRTTDLAAGPPLIAGGAVASEFHPAIAADCASTLADAVLIAVPGYAHCAVIDQATPHLRTTQPVMFSSHMSFSLLYLLQQRAAHGAAPPLIACGTTVVTGRQTGPCEAFVAHIRS